MPSTVISIAALLFLVSISISYAQDKEKIYSSEAACSILKRRIGEFDKVDENIVDTTWFCDADYDLSNQDWWVIGLRAFNACEDGCCSNLRGWFAVSKHSDEVREYNMAELIIGKSLKKP